MKVLNNLKVSSKLIISLALSLIFMLIIGTVGFMGIKAGKRNVESLYNEQYQATDKVSDFLNNVERARVALVTMLSSANYQKVEALEGFVASRKGDTATLSAIRPDSSRLNPFREKIAAMTKESGESLEKLLSSPYTDESMRKKLNDIKEVWGAFVKTRDEELIPLIYEGKTDEANKIGLGIQAERYGKFTALARELADQENKEAMDGIREADAELKSFSITMISITILALLTGMIASMAISNSISRRIVAVATEAEAMADGNLGRTADVSGADEIGALASSFNKMSNNLKDLINSISQASNQIASASEELSATAEQMAKGMQMQTSQTSQVASAMEEMSATVLQVAKNSQSAASSAKDATSTAQKGGNVVSRSVEGMQRIAATVQESARTIMELGKSSDQIGEIVAVIDDIADQTNLLALNAAIEAARAGEQGRGFAVVADEVRKLAERTTKATKEIALMIKNIQKETQGAVAAMEAGTKEVADGVSLAKDAGSSLSVIIEAVDRVNDMISQIATASEQQSAAAEEISTSVEGIASVTKETASGSQQTSAASQELSRMAVELQRMVGQFKI